MKALLVAPVFDDVTAYSYAWSREARRLLESRGFAVQDIGGREVARREVEDALKDADILCFFDHGSVDALYGSRSEAVVDLGNAGTLSGREVYTMACFSARRLGLEAWKLGARAYWGYEKAFAFTTDALDAFGEFSVCGLRARLEGRSWSEALQAARKLGRSLAERLAGEGKLMASSCMSYDAEALRCYDGEEPSTKCPLRRLALRLLGRRGWYVSRLRGMGVLAFGIGYGMALHDYAHALWQVGGYGELLSPQGGYIGFALMLLSFVAGFLDFMRAARR
jgi:hypothetical protein